MGDRFPQNWSDVSLPLNLKGEMFLFTLIETRCDNGKANP